MILLIWRGWGILTPIIALFVAFTAEAVAKRMTADPVAQHYALGLGFILAAALLWWLGRRLNNRPGRILVDLHTGQQVHLRRRHDFFYIPMQYWAVGALILAPFAATGALGDPIAASSTTGLGQPAAGTIQFGADVADGWRATIVTPHAAFRPHETIAWIASLAYPTSSPHLGCTIARQDSDGHYIIVTTYTVTHDDPLATLLVFKFDVSSWAALHGLSTPGVYQLTYDDNGIMVAHGSFQLLAAEPIST